MYSKPLNEIFENNKTIYKHIDGIWSFGLADKTNHKASKNNEGFKYIYLFYLNISRNVLGVYHLRLMKTESPQTKTEEFSNNLTKSKRESIETESDRGADLKSKILESQYYTSFFKIW